MQTQNVITDKEREIRKRDLEESDRRREEDQQEEQKSKNFTQVYPLGWKRLLELAKANNGAFGLYTFLAQHIDGSCGAVVADQALLAEEFSVTTRTIRNWVSFLESERALVKIPVAGRVYAYALNPHEVWKGYNNNKKNAAFLTQTLVNKDGDIKRRIMAMFSPDENK